MLLIKFSVFWMSNYPHLIFDQVRLLNFPPTLNPIQVRYLAALRPDRIYTSTYLRVQQLDNTDQLLNYHCRPLPLTFVQYLPDNPDIRLLPALNSIGAHLLIADGHGMGVGYSGGGSTRVTTSSSHHNKTTLTNNRRHPSIIYTHKPFSAPPITNSGREVLR